MAKQQTRICVRRFDAGELERLRQQADGVLDRGAGL
jgi:hypothetical protein